MSISPDVPQFGSYNYGYGPVELVQSRVGHDLALFAGGALLVQDTPAGADHPLEALRLRITHDQLEQMHALYRREIWQPNPITPAEAEAMGPEALATRIAGSLGEILDAPVNLQGSPDIRRKRVGYGSIRELLQGEDPDRREPQGVSFIVDGRDAPLGLAGKRVVVGIDGRYIAVLDREASAVDPNYEFIERMHDISAVHTGRNDPKLMQEIPDATLPLDTRVAIANMLDRLSP